MAKLFFEDFHNEIDSLNLKLAAAVELAETLKELLADISGNNVSNVNVSFDANGRPYKTATYHKRETFDSADKDVGQGFWNNYGRK